MTNQQLSIKAFLWRSGDKPEVRRFCVPQEGSIKFGVLENKLNNLFQTASEENFTITWKDTDGDSILISSDEELKIAVDDLLQDSKKEVLKLHMHLKGESAPLGGDTHTQSDTHPHVVCDGCEGEVRGFRYKCLQCPDYDLCSTCEANGLHPGHNMVRISVPGGYMSYGFPMGRRGGGGGHGGCHKGWRRSGRGCPAWWGEGGAWNVGQSSGQKDWEKQWKDASKNLGEMIGNVWTILGGMNINDPTPSTSETNTKEGANGGTDGSKTSEGKQATAGREYLRQVGEAVATMLDPLGVDVQVDVEHAGQRKSCRPKQCNRANKKKTDKSSSSEETSGAKDSSPEPTSEKQQTAADLSGEDWTIINEKSASPSAPTPPETTKEVTSVPETASTAINESSAATTTEATRAVSQNMYPDLPTQPPNPNPRVTRALELMMSMGFTNDGGWLTQLLEAKNGDIGATLDVLQPIRK